MLRSMTGFGQASGDSDKFSIKVEFKALNGKFLDINLRMPRLLQSKEIEIRNTYGKLLERGSINLSISFDFKNTGDLLQPLNKEVIGFYLDESWEIEKKYGLAKGSMSGSVFNIPNALQTSDKELSEEAWKQILAMLQKSFEAFDAFRLQEGKETEKEIRGMVKRIVAFCEEIGALEGERMQGIRDKIKGDLETFIGKDQVDSNRFEQELVYYVEKIDIAEEKLRLKNHCNYFLQTMEEASSGKKLSFIAQEMGREINTIGAKANFFEIQKRIVQMKDELEKIKEQLNNVI